MKAATAQHFDWLVGKAACPGSQRTCPGSARLWTTTTEKSGPDGEAPTFPFHPSISHYYQPPTTPLTDQTAKKLIGSHFRIF